MTVGADVGPEAITEPEFFDELSELELEAARVAVVNAIDDAADVITVSHITVGEDEDEPAPMLTVKGATADPVKDDLREIGKIPLLSAEQEVDLAVEVLSSLLEPIIMVILGILVGGLVIAMYLPIFKLGSVI